ncbi:MAG: hypothetical protein HOO67_07300 [Candidatus Peribacteraceae bacterium]|nr:hypothetical protein [Candidatus Peribacteraceae bacterium]
MRTSFIVAVLCVLCTVFPVRLQAASDRRILTRAEWGADESLRVAKPSEAGDTEEETSTRTSEEAPSVRDKECEDAYAKYPNEFKASVPVTKNAQGEDLRWPMTYSSSVRLLVVHHTAIAVAGDKRSGLEKMRALYQYHAQNRGWGDIGYHYVIDDQGQIYEGRAGGDFVVGGHVYCNNVGTVGISLMGNFDKEQPTQDQAKSLQWLLQLLAQKYNINTSRDAVFHGKTLSPIVGHRQLVSTDCPGTAMWSAMDQVRNHVRTGEVAAAVTFPEMEIVLPAGAGNDEELPKGSIVTGTDGLASVSETVIEGRPGAEVSIPVFFRATTKSYVRNTRIARITRSAGLDVWLEKDGTLVPARDLRIPVPLVKKGESVIIRVRVKLPMERGSAALKIGSLNYTFEMSGRASRTRQLLNTNQGYSTLRENSAPIQQTRFSASSSSPSSPSLPSLPSKSIRIRLTPDLPMNGLVCGDPSVRFTSENDLVRVQGYFRSIRSYRGKVECQVIGGELVLINELSVEEYMLGLAEEPDTEPFEKQRAFAIAARTYATYYAEPAHRKFPGMPYDGSDSPATFQAYHGQNFEARNPQWLKAVHETERSVLTYKGQVIRAPYFSTDTGKTRTPDEAGWKDFPFPEIFTPKDDPWCVGMKLAGHGVGMSGCGAGGQARQGKTAEQILSYYYPGTVIEKH